MIYYHIGTGRNNLIYIEIESLMSIIIMVMNTYWLWIKMITTF